jgi:nicotinamidase-related amidase
MAPLEIDSSSSALVLIDLQRGIAAGETKPHAARDVVARGAELAGAFRA